MQLLPVTEPMGGPLPIRKPAASQKEHPAGAVSEVGARAEVAGSA